MATQLFNQADINHDQTLDINEFRNLIAQNLGPNASIYTGNGADAGEYIGGAYESSPPSAGTYGDVSGGNVLYGGAANIAGANIGRADLAGGQSGYSSYEQASYASSAGVGANGFDASTTSGANLSGAAAAASSSSFEASSAQQQIQQYATNSQGLYQDPNPEIVRRPAPGGQVTYTQSIKIRFLQPPAIPPPGPLIIKEVRPPQPPPPPPLVVRQRAPPLPSPPPLILRERPPAIPASLAAQTVIRQLPALPIPPRSVIIERLPALPPKPRDIIIERWIPYSAMSKRKTIVQRAEAVKEYPKPRNVIIQYEAPQVRVIRQFQRLGITPENPQAYVLRYGAALFDSQTLIQQARAAGVVEDISPPQNFVPSGADAAGFASGNSGGEAAGGRSSSSSFASSSYGAQQGGAGLANFESAQGNLGGNYSSIYQSGSSLSRDGNGVTPGYEVYGTSAGNRFDGSQSVFNSADINNDGSIDPNEFRQFLGSQLQ